MCFVSLKNKLHTPTICIKCCHVHLLPGTHSPQNPDRIYLKTICRVVWRHLLCGDGNKNFIIALKNVNYYFWFSQKFYSLLEQVVIFLHVRCKMENRYHSLKLWLWKWQKSVQVTHGNLISRVLKDAMECNKACAHSFAFYVSSLSNKFRLIAKDTYYKTVPFLFIAIIPALHIPFQNKLVLQLSVFRLVLAVVNRLRIPVNIKAAKKGSICHRGGGGGGGDLGLEGPRFRLEGPKRHSSFVLQ